jgi:hypothetical protein
MNLIIKTSNKIIENKNLIDFNSLWFWLSIGELLLIIYLIYRLKSKKVVSELTDLEMQNIQNSKNNPIDMNSLMNNIHNARGLYKELSRKCHPDRFIGDPKHQIAEDIFQEISDNERNYEKLNQLKTRAINELNINF